MSQDDDVPLTRADTGRTGTPPDSLATRAPASDAGKTTFTGTMPTSSSAGPGPAGSRFRVLRPHARGGLGEVHVAQDIELRREVALKQIQDHHADRQDSRSRFLLEAEITGGLEHPGIVPVYGLGQYADGRPYYAMRFIRGDSLKEAIDRFHAAPATGESPERRLELRNLLGRLVDVCQAMAYAHSRGVLHRDLKPGNIMLGKYGETLVVDWGLAKPVDQPADSQAGEPSLSLSSESSVAATQMGAVVGTPQFMSPEQAAGDLEHMGPASDTYSLGATLYVLLTGKLPFVDKDLNRILDRARRGDFPRPREVNRNIPRPLEAICLKAMALKPEDRYESPLALAQDIEHWLADEPVSAWKEPWTVKAARWLRRHRTFASAAFTGIVATSIVLGIATVLLTAANERERQAKDAARKQRDIAESNYRLARGAVDRYHTEVSDEVLLNEPGMQELRKKLLGAAQEFYQKFVEARQHDADAKAELGRAYYRLAQITGEIESEAKAITWHEKAATLFEQLPAAEVARDLARCYHHLGRLQRITDRLRESATSYEKALGIWDGLAKTQPTDADLRAELARSHLGLGNLHQVTRRTADASKEYENALELRAQLLTAHPRNLAYQRDLAVTYSNLGMIHAQAHESAAAEASFRKARELQEKLVAERPALSQYQDDLSRTDFNLGDLALRRSQPKEAQASFLAAASRWRDLVRAHPAVLDFQTNLAEALGNAGHSLRLLGEFAQAENTAQEALTIRQKLADEHADVASYRSDLARGYLQLADIYREARNAEKARPAYEKNIDIQKELAAKFPETPQYAAELARAHNNLGLLHLADQRADDAANSFASAERVWEKLQQSHREADEFAVGLSIARSNLSQAQRSAGKLAQALASSTRAIAAVQHSAEKSGKHALCTAHWRRAEAHTAVRQHGKALEDWDAALRLANTGERIWFTVYRMMTRARLGEYQVVVAEADALVAKAGRSPKALFCLACVYSLAAESANSDDRISPENRRTMVEEYCNRGIELLGRANQLGYFRDSTNARQLSDEPALAFLQNHDAFRKLLQTSVD